jgi:hypothetical protein
MLGDFPPPLAHGTPDSIDDPPAHRFAYHPKVGPTHQGFRTEVR